MKSLQLGSVCQKIGSGATPRGGKQAYQTSGISLIRSQNVYNNMFTLDGLAYISHEQADKLANVVVEEEDVLLNITGDSTARACKVPSDVLPARVNQHVAIIRPRRDVLHPRYLMYFLVSPRMQALMLSLSAGGATRKALTKGMIESFQVPAPPMSEQEEVVEILGAFDDKIELNRKMNETLEAMARAIFKSWFVDFDPVRAKTPAPSPSGGRPGWGNYPALFPDSFQDSPLGKIPKGWEVSPLGDHVEAVKGLSYKGKFLSDAGMPMHNLNSVFEGGRYKHEGLKHYTGEYKDRHVVRPGDVIVTNTEQGFEYLLIGCPAIVPKCYGETGIFSHHIFRVRPSAGSWITRHFVYLLLLSQRFRDEVTGYTNGTTVNMLPVEGLLRPEFVVPPHKVAERFTDIVVPLFEKQEQIHEECQVLTATRDALLPKLLSGVVRVKP